MATSTKKFAMVGGIPTLVAPYSTSTTLVSNLTAGTSLTLPSSQSYLGSELMVFVNGQFQQPTVDWNTTGSSPYTAIVFTGNWKTGDVVEFTIK